MRYLIIGNKTDLPHHQVDGTMVASYVRSLHTATATATGGTAAATGAPVGSFHPLRASYDDIHQGEMYCESSVKDNTNISEPLRTLLLRTMVDRIVQLASPTDTDPIDYPPHDTQIAY